MMCRDLEHPEIGWIERTGYPSWMQERAFDEDDDCLDEEDEDIDDDDGDIFCED